MPKLIQPFSLAILMIAIIEYVSSRVIDYVLTWTVPYTVFIWLNK